MATYTCSISTHQTSGSAVDEIDLAADVAQVEVLNRDGASAIYFTVDGLGGPAGAGVPTVAGKDCYVVAAAAGASLKVTSRSTAATVVKLITASATAYSVTAVNE